MSKLIFLSILWLMSESVMAQQPDFKQLLEVGLPLVEIITVDGEEPTCDYVSPPDGMEGQTIDNATKVPGRLRKWSGGECVYDSEDYIADSCGMRIKIRGNTSAYEPKKSFKVKLEKKADLLLRDNDSIYQDREWLLMKEDYNIEGGELLYLMIGLKVAQLCGMPWEPEAEFVNLLVNGDYRGVYMLTESVKRGGHHRIQTDKATGYIIEMNPYWWKEDIYLVTDLHRKRYTFKYPQSDEVSAEQMTSVKKNMDDVEKAIWNGSFDTLFDVNNLSSWLMAHDILGTWDSAGSNIYLTKYDDTDSSKMKMGPLWDFGSIMRMSGQWATIHTNESFYFRYLFEMAADANRPFCDAYVSQWEERGQYVPDEMVQFMRTFLDSEEAAALQTCYEWDEARWEHHNPTVEEMGQKAIRWFEERKVWMTEIIQTYASIHTLPSLEKKPYAVKYYDLMGRMVTPTSRGVYIEKFNNVKKRIVNGNGLTP